MPKNLISVKDVREISKYKWRKIYNVFYLSTEKNKFWFFTSMTALVIIKKNNTIAFFLPNIFSILMFFAACALMASHYDIIKQMSAVSNNSIIDCFLSKQGKQLLATQLLPCVTLYTMMYFGFMQKQYLYFSNNMEVEFRQI